MYYAREFKDGKSKDISLETKDENEANQFFDNKYGHAEVAGNQAACKIHRLPRNKNSRPEGRRLGILKVSRIFFYRRALIASRPDDVQAQAGSNCMSLLEVIPGTI